MRPPVYVIRRRVILLEFVHTRSAASSPQSSALVYNSYPWAQPARSDENGALDWIEHRLHDTLLPYYQEGMTRHDINGRRTLLSDGERCG